MEWLFPIIFIEFLGLGLTLFGFLQFRKNWRVKKIPLFSMENPKEGLVEIKGRAIATSNLKGPFSQKNVAFFRCTIDQFRQGNRRSFWVPVLIFDSLDESFYLLKEQEKFLVNAKGADIEFKEHYSLLTSPEKGIPPHVAKALKQKSFSIKTSKQKIKQLRIIEYYIEEGSELYVLGHFKNHSFSKGEKEFFKITQGNPRKNLKGDLLFSLMELTIGLGFAFCPIALFILK